VNVDEDPINKSTAPPDVCVGAVAACTRVLALFALAGRAKKIAAPSCTNCYTMAAGCFVPCEASRLPVCGEARPKPLGGIDEDMNWDAIGVFSMLQKSHLPKTLHDSVYHSFHHPRNAKKGGFKTPLVMAL